MKILNMGKNEKSLRSDNVDMNDTPLDNKKCKQFDCPDLLFYKTYSFLNVDKKILHEYVRHIFM